MIPNHELYKALTIAVHAVPDQKPSMPSLCSLLLDFPTPDTMHLVGTDGERIAVVTLCLQHGQPTGTSFRIAPSDARAMIDHVDAMTGRCTLAIWGDTFMVSAGEDCAVVERLVDGLEYPDWPKVMQAPKAAKPLPVPFERALLAEALEVLRHVADNVAVDINGCRSRGYVDAVLREGFECITAVRIGVSQRTVAAGEVG